MTRDSFVFYRSFAEALSDLDAETYKTAMQAITDYALYGIEPQCSGLPHMVFTLVKPQIDANNQRFAVGKKGGRPRKPMVIEDTENEKPTVSEISKNKKPTVIEKGENQKPNVNVNVNVNENVNVNDKKNKYIPSSFDKFWSEYPRKVGKASAEAVYMRKAVDAETEQAILDGLHRYNSLQWSRWTGQQRQYIPHPTTWLNQGRWTDTVEQNGKPVPSYMLADFDDNTADSDLDELKELMGKL